MGTLDKKSEKFSASKTIKNGTTSKTVRVEEVENGFLVIIEKNWRDKKDCYQWEEKKYISTVNPFDKKAKVDSKITSDKSLGESLSNFLTDESIEIDI